MKCSFRITLIFFRPTLLMISLLSTIMYKILYMTRLQNDFTMILKLVAYYYLYHTPFTVLHLIDFELLHYN